MRRIATLLTLIMASSALAGGPPAEPIKAAPCGPTYVEKEVLVPTWVYETKKVLVDVCRPIEKTRKATYYRRQPETRVVTEECLIHERKVTYRDVVEKIRVPVVRHEVKVRKVRVPKWQIVQREIECQVPKTVWVDEPCTVWEPVREKKKGKRVVWKTVTTKEKQMVCRDAGHWEEREVAVAAPCAPCRGCRTGLLARVFSCRSCPPVACDPCGPVVAKPATATCRVWVPKVVQEEVEVTVERCVPTEEEYEYVSCSYKAVNTTRKVAKCVYETQKRMINERVCTYELRDEKYTVPVCEFEIKEVKRRVCDVSYEPKTVQRKRTVVECKLIKEVRDEKYIDYETVKEEKEVQVCVCKMVAKKVRVPVGCAPCKPCAQRGLRPAVSWRGRLRRAF